MRIVALLLMILAAAGWSATKPYVVIVTGDHEYSGEQTLPLLARELERQYGFRCTVLRASPDQNAEENIPGLEALAQADLAIFYLRWRRLPKEQLAHIDAYVKSGKPLLGFRTSSHSFNYAKGDEREAWNRWGVRGIWFAAGLGKRWTYSFRPRVQHRCEYHSRRREASDSARSDADFPRALLAVSRATEVATAGRRKTAGGEGGESEQGRRRESGGMDVEESLRWAGFLHDARASGRYGAGAGPAADFQRDLLAPGASTGTLERAHAD